MQETNDIPTIALRRFDSGMHIIWNGIRITQDQGIAIAIQTCGMWTDSSCASWHCCVDDATHVRYRVEFAALPLSLYLDFKITGDSQVVWCVDGDVEEWLSIDEIRFLGFMHLGYKEWMSDFFYSDFPRCTDVFRDVYKDEYTVSCMGVRGAYGSQKLPLCLFESAESTLFPLVQNPPISLGAHVIGLRQVYRTHSQEYMPGEYRIFEGTITISRDASLIEKKIVHVREKLAQTLKRRCEQKKEGPPRVALLNLPWQSEGQWGVRAGSRWPHIKDATEGDYLPFPFFLAYAAALLEKHHIDATVIDALAEKISEDRFLERVAGLDVDYLVVETSIPSLQYDIALMQKLAVLNIPIIVCGPIAEIQRPVFLKQYPFVTYVLYGEYEFTLLELLQSLYDNRAISHVRGIVFRDGETVRTTLPRMLCAIDDLPWPQRDTVPMNRYLDAPGEMKTPCAQIVASRGCPFRCQFCLWPQVMYQGNQYRVRSVKDVVDEMEYMVAAMGFQSIYFDDDTFNVGKERMLDFCREIKQRGLDTVQWAIMARADLMDEEILDAMKDAGLWAVKYGVESANQELVDKIGKNLDIQKAERMIAHTQALGIRTHLTFTFGLPGETHETINKTIDFALRMNPFSVQFSIMTPFPGTEYFTALDAEGHIVNKDFSAYDGHAQCVIKTGTLLPEDLEKAKNEAYRRWHTRQQTCDIVLLQAPPWDSIMPPLGIAYLSTYVRNHGRSSVVYDLNVKLANSVEPAYRYLWDQKSYQSWVDCEKFECIWPHIENTVQEDVQRFFRTVSPRYIGISVTYAGIHFVAKLIPIIKQVVPDCTVIVGGWGCVNEHMRKMFPTDLVGAFVIGEGEATLMELMEVFEGKKKPGEVEGAVFPAKKKLPFFAREVITELNSIPWPTFEEFDLREYKHPVLPLFTSRGCISKCTFCNDWRSSLPYRFRTAEHICEEIRYHLTHNNVKTFSFKNLLCNGNMKELLRFAEIVIGEKLPIQWDSQAISRKEMTYDVLETLRAAGCSTLIYGVESFSDTVLQNMGKIFSAEVAERVIEDTHKAGIKVIINIIVGFPGETEENFQETLRALERIRPSVSSIGAVSACLINEGSALDRDPAKYGCVMSDNTTISAREWVSSDGENTYALRKERAYQLLELLKTLALDVATIGV